MAKIKLPKTFLYARTDAPPGEISVSGAFSCRGVNFFVAKNTKIQLKFGGSKIGYLIFHAATGIDVTRTLKNCDHLKKKEAIINRFVFVLESHPECLDFLQRNVIDCPDRYPVINDLGGTVFPEFKCVDPSKPEEKTILSEDEKLTKILNAFDKAQSLRYNGAKVEKWKVKEEYSSVWLGIGEKTKDLNDGEYTIEKIISFAELLECSISNNEMKSENGFSLTFFLESPLGILG